MKITIMNQFNGLRALFSVVAILMVFTTVNINSAYAQDPTPSPSPEPTPYKKVRKHKEKDLDDLRAKITDVFTTVENASNTITPANANDKKRMKAAKDKLAVMTYDDLDQLRDSIDPTEIEDDLQDAKDKLTKVKPGLTAAYAESGVSLWNGDGDSDSAQSVLPGIADPNVVCKTLIGMGKAQLDVIVAANAAYLVAKIISIALNRGCNQVVVAGVVVLGNGGVGGGNSSLACIISDGLMLIADQVRDKVSYCDTDFTRRSVDTAVERMATVHGDIASLSGKIDATKTAVDGARTDILADALLNKTAIMDAMGKNTTTITTAVGDGTTTIVKNDNTNTGNIIANANLNQVALIKLQIASDLATADNSTLVGAFMIPAAKGGYLEIVRAVVEQAIKELAGSSMSQANSLFLQGKASEDAGDFKNAYASYRRAYKLAVK